MDAELSEIDKGFIAALVGSIGLSEIAEKLEITRTAVKRYAVTLGYYETKADHLRVLHANGVNKKEALEIAGLKRSEHGRVFGITPEPTIKPGHVFGLWTVISEAGKTARRIKKYLCECRCGARKELRHDVLSGMKSHSCGCSSGKQKKIDIVQRNPAYKNKVRHGNIDSDRGGLARILEAYKYKQEHGCGVSAACKHTGASVATWYKYINKIQESGEQKCNTQHLIIS